FFRDPDVILIDGRFRAATFIAAYLRIKKPTIVLFDDYKDRQSYHAVERVEKPYALHGRMAEFHIEPGQRPIWIHDFFSDLVGQATFSYQTHFPYPPLPED